MTRVKKGVNANKTRRNTLKRTKGYRFGRSTKEALANEAIFHAGSHAFAHRRDKKGDFRRLWNVRLNAALRQNGTTFSKFIGSAKKKGIEINRKMLAEMAAQSPESFGRLMKKVS